MESNPLPTKYSDLITSSAAARDANRSQQTGLKRAFKNSSCVPKTFAQKMCGKTGENEKKKIVERNYKNKQKSDKKAFKSKK